VFWSVGFHQLDEIDRGDMSDSSSEPSRENGARYFPKNISAENALDESLKWMDPSTESGSSSSLEGTVLLGPGYWSLPCTLPSELISSGSGQNVKFPVEIRGNGSLSGSNGIFGKFVSKNSCSVVVRSRKGGFSAGGRN